MPTPRSLTIVNNMGEDPSRCKGRPRAGRPSRVARPGLTIRREQTRDGYALHFSGRDADSGLLDAVIDEIDRLFGPA